MTVLGREQEESKSSRKEGDENLILTSQTRKDKEKGSNKGKGEESASQSGKKKDLSNIKYFVCHKHGHYALKCLERKKGRGNSQQSKVVASIEIQMSEFVVKFEKDLSFISCLSTNSFQDCMVHGQWCIFPYDINKGVVSQFDGVRLRSTCGAW